MSDPRDVHDKHCQAPAGGDCDCASRVVGEPGPRTIRGPEDLSKVIEEAAARGRRSRESDPRWMTPLLVAAHDLAEAIVVALMRSWGGSDRVMLKPFGNWYPPESDIVSWAETVIRVLARERDWSVKVPLFDVALDVTGALLSACRGFVACATYAFDADAFEQNLFAYLKDKATINALSDGKLDLASTLMRAPDVRKVAPQ